MLIELVGRDLAAAAAPEIRRAAARLAREHGAAAVLFYGSVLRSQNLDDVLDFYVLTPSSTGTLLRRMVAALLWPDVSWREIDVGARTIRAKVAVMPLAMFERAASGELLDTTIWARFAQPSALIWSAGPDDAERVVHAVAAAIVTAARFAAVLGPRRGTPLAFWRALFTGTYRAEFRFERTGRSEQIVAHARARYESLLPLAWRLGGIDFTERAGQMEPRVAAHDVARLLAAWRARAAAGKPLNIARLIKAAFTFEGATRYALYKIERHTGVRIAATAWQERHPVLAAPGVLWRVFRAKPS